MSSSSLEPSLDPSVEDPSSEEDEPSEEDDEDDEEGEDNVLDRCVVAEIVLWPGAGRLERVGVGGEASNLRIGAEAILRVGRRRLPEV